MRASMISQNLNKRHSSRLSNKRSLPSPWFMEECRDNKGCIVLVVFNHKQMIIDSFKHCTLTIATDDREVTTLNLTNHVQQN